MSQGSPGRASLTHVGSGRDVLGNGFDLDIEAYLGELLAARPCAVAIGGGKSVVYITALPPRVFPRASSFARARSGSESG